MKKIGNFILFLISGMIIFDTGVLLGTRIIKIIRKKEDYAGYQRHFFDQCTVENREHGILLDGFFLRKGYTRIVVYGLGAYYHELLRNIHPENYKEIILSDQGADAIASGDNYKVVSPQDLLDESFYDVIVVTSYNHEAEIKRDLREMGIKKPIISYRELVINATKERR